MSRRTRRAAVMGAVALLAAVVAGCGVDPDVASPSASTKAPSSTEATTSTGTDSRDRGVAVLDALAPVVALVETPSGSGSAVLLDDGHLVTNAHVVDPFARVQVTLDGEVREEVPVVGVDLDADVAVLGPIDTETQGVTLEDPSGLAVGSDLYLVGFPGDADDAEVTIARGVLSRFRTLDEWDIEMVQTDAAISGGQSGGALADADGRLVGISGYSLDDQYALAVSGPDVAASVEAIESGDGSDWHPLPAAEDATARSATLDLSGLGEGVAYVPPSAEERTWTIQTAPEAGALLLVTDGVGDVLGLNAGYEDLLAADPDDEGDRPTATAADAPGRWSFEIPAETPALLHATTDDLATEVGITSSLPFAEVTPDTTPVPVEVGDSVRGDVGFVDTTDVFSLPLEAGESVTLRASSALGDVSVSVEPPAGGGEGATADDGAGGIFDLDAELTFTATVAGVHLIDVEQVDGYPTGYRLTVEVA